MADEREQTAADLQRVLTMATAAAEGNAPRQDIVTPDLDQPAHNNDEPPPPAYNDFIQDEVEHNDTALGVDTKACISDDGRFNININQRSRRLSTVFDAALQSQLERQATHQEPLPPPYIPPSLGGEPGQQPPPPLNVVIHVVGSRGDVQPFVALGKVLKETYGHRVRLATHPVFQSFVLENGLEFFSIGGDPAALMAWMVKNPGIMPGFDTVRSGDVGMRRRELATMIKGCWRSCIETGDGTGVEVTDETVEEWMNASVSDPSSRPEDKAYLLRPFIADAIIANPPSFAHIHCAEKLGCPLHIMFTMPYSPTQAFPHPLANIQSSNADPSVTNYLSYGMVDLVTWQGLGDLVNHFRMTTLDLSSVSVIWAPGMLARLRVPHTYCWSPALIPKPKDWGNHISISGFYFLSLASNFHPEPELEAFLHAGPAPVYIGFGSIVVDDPTAMTKMVFEAIRKTGQRALVSKGWGGIGVDELGVPDGVMMLGNVPHDWLFQHVSAVVHHGGAGTTAAGITAGRPTVVVPFFGDQPFWGAMVAKAGAGPEPIPYSELNADKLAHQIEFALKPSTLERAQELADAIRNENGSQSGAQSFHQQINLDSVRCSLAPSRAAVWRIKRTNVRLSALAATVLGNEGLLDFQDLKLFRAREYETDSGPTDPISGAGGAIVGTASSILMGFADFPIEAMKKLGVHPDYKKSKKDKKKKAEEGDKDTPSTSTSNVNVDAALADYSAKQSMDGHTTETSSIATDEAGAHSPTTVTSPSSSEFNVHESLARLHADDEPSGTTTPRSSMRAALRDEFVRKTREQSPSRKSSFHGLHVKDVDTVISTGKGVARMVDAGLRSSWEITTALSKGFHNAPKLYGDDTVRRSEPVTDIKSGLVAAGKEFGFGMYDGITGLVTQPLRGAKKEGAAGFIKGFGKGIGGVMMKPSAAVLGLTGYTMKGIYKQLQGKFGSSVQNYIIAARTAQGFEDWQLSSAEERADIQRRWAATKDSIKYKKHPGEKLHEWQAEHAVRNSAAVNAYWKRVHERLDRTDVGALLRKHGRGVRDGSSGPPAAHIERRYTTGPLPPPGSHAAATDSGVSTPSDSDPLTPASSSSSDMPRIAHAATAPMAGRYAGDVKSGRARSDDEDDDAELDEAVRRSVAETSAGDAASDAQLARALRASAVQVGVVETERRGREEEEERAFRAAVVASLAEAEERGGQEDAGEEEGEEDEGLAEAIRESLALEGREKREEEIVLQHVLRQSRAEEAYRRNVVGKGGSGSGAGEGSGSG